jgi:hypothetical protein
MRNLLTHGVPPHARYVLLITADTGYLWSSPKAALQGVAPLLTFPMDRITRHYLRSNDEATPVPDIVLQAVVEQWLWDLTDGVAVDDQVTSSLRDSGFLSAVRDGLVAPTRPYERSESGFVSRLRSGKTIIRPRKGSSSSHSSAV